MKIVRIIARLNVGGPARHVVWLSKELNDTEFQTELLAGTVPEGEEDMNWFAAENSVEPVFIEEMSRELSPKDVISLWKIYRALKEAKPDIVRNNRQNRRASLSNFQWKKGKNRAYFSRTYFSQLLRKIENKDFFDN